MNELTKRKTTISIQLNQEDIEKIFQRKKIKDVYSSIRNSETVTSYYNNMIETVKQNNKRNALIQEILADDDVAEDNERIIKTQLIEKALDLILTGKTKDFEFALILVINEVNVLMCIDDLEELLEETLNEFCNKIVEDSLFRVGLKFLN